MGTNPGLLKLNTRAERYSGLRRLKNMHEKWLALTDMVNVTRVAYLAVDVTINLHTTLNVTRVAKCGTRVTYCGPIFSAPSLGGNRLPESHPATPRYRRAQIPQHRCGRQRPGVRSSKEPATREAQGGSDGLTADRQLGAATALHLARSGHDLVVNYRRDRDAAEQVVAGAVGVGVRAVAVRADVVREADVERLFEVAEQELGPLTGLVNNAGVTAHVGDLADTPPEVVRQVLDVNLLGVILCARRAAQIMSSRRGGLGGAIVNVSSAAATLGAAHEYVHYAAAKAAAWVDALTIGLSQELADDGIRVNAVAPGTIRTDIHAAAGDPDRPDRIAKSIPLGRAGEPRDVAPAIAWLLSDEASYITGAIVRVAGGR